MSKRLDTPAAVPTSRVLPTVASVVAIASAFAFAMSLAVRPLASVDLGYHLAYGEEFWRHGRIVDDDSFIHPQATAETTKAGDLPPGCHFDSQGRLHFV